jgi:hypothetical protein
MASRYTNNSKKIITSNDNNETLSNLLNKRQINKITFYETSTINNLTSEQISFLNFEQHVWSFGDKYWKLASTYYNDPNYWWVIAWFNEKPTEASVKIGDIIYVPKPLSVVLGFFNA